MKFLERLLHPRIYLDYAAATPVRPEVLRAMAPYHDCDFANASSIHEEGRKARAAVSAARANIARILRVRSDEVFFVSGGTEANNLALQGVIEAMVAGGRVVRGAEVITTALEHPSVTKTLTHMSRYGIVVHTVPVDSDGLIDVPALHALLSPQTILISFAYVNSEIGVVQDIKRITHLIRKFRQTHGTTHPFVHLDASQAPLYLPCAVDSLGVDLMTLDAGKFYGPKGVGVLMQKKHVPLAPLLFGGGQEGGVRSGTENTALIVGCAEALRIADVSREDRVRTVTALREYGFSKLLTIPGALANGSRTERVANNISISIPDVDGEFAMVTLDVAGIAVSTKSACGGLESGGSNVIRALGGTSGRARGALRITLGEESTKRDLDQVHVVLSRHVQETREALDQLNKK